MSNLVGDFTTMSDVDIMLTIEQKFRASRFSLITEPSYDVSCRQCDNPIILDASIYRHYENNKANGTGFSIPKCADCWGIE